jgi:DNA-binding NarL/FixJ family response regulator
MITHLERHTQRNGVCHTRTHLVADRPWYRSPDYNIIQASVNVDHIMWCFRTIAGTNDESTGMVLNRQKGRRDYTLREVAVIQEANTALTPLIGGVLARFSDPSPYALAPRVRDVLACMLEGDSDKQIAQRLTISSYTVNQYAKLIYTHFHVNSRAQLLAQWIRRNRGSQFPWAN